MRRTVATSTAWAALSLGLLFAACAGPEEPVRIGAKAYTEQAIFAEILRGLVEAEGVDAEVVDCGDTWQCHQRLVDGEFDLMVEYSGTALLWSGGAAPRRHDPIGQVAALQEVLGLRWVADLGFENTYRLYVTPTAARGLTSPTLEALADIGPIRVACPTEFTRRPGDGLADLLTRYGLALEGQPLVIDDAGQRYRALLDGRADVVVGYSTDGELLGLDLVSLDDTLGFFPPYAAGVVAHSGLFARVPGLEQSLAALDGTFDDGAVQRLNYAVTVEGRSVAAVAAGLLADRGYAAASPTAIAGADIIVAAHPTDAAGPTAGLAVEALRATFPGRVVRWLRVASPIKAVAVGEARIAYVGAERFFTAEGRDDRLEAAAVVGVRAVHVVRVESNPDPLAGRVGVMERTSGGGTIGAAMLQAVGASPAERADVSSLLAHVAAGSLDAAIIVAPVGDPAIEAASNLSTAPLAGWLDPERALALPYLSPMRIPAGTYPGQAGPIETLGAQLVLASTARRRARGTTIGGPVTALPESGVPLTPTQVDALAEATGFRAAPDPALPSAWGAATGDEEDDRPQWRDTFLNLAVILFLLWWLRVTFGDASEGGGPDVDLSAQGRDT